MFSSNEQTVCSIRPIDVGRSIVDIAGALRGEAYPWLLDSSLRSDRLGRFSFAGADPYLVIRAHDDRVEVDCRRAVRTGSSVGQSRLRGDPMQIARALMPAPPSGQSNGSDTTGPTGEQPGDALPFLGGAVGYLGYELAAQFDRYAFGSADDLGLPDLVLLYVDSLIAYDAVDDRLYACGLGFDEDPVRAGRAAERACELASARALADPPAATSLARKAGRFAKRPAPRVAPEPDASSYAKAIDAAKQEIEAGEVYQTCLTRRFERSYTGDSWALYQRLREINPAPFASYFELPEVTIVGSSPERFVRLDGCGRVESRPIKGTRPRGATDREDRTLRAELEASEKDRAENLMIVDLVRNDIGRVCETGSVEVPELMAIESYASVHQMVSTIRGRLRSDRDAFDLVRATFPPGSMTGAPKIAAMQILDRLEPVRRGIYSGAIGYFDVRSGTDLCVVIRTILLRGDRAILHTGGGIVADSDPAEEWAETLAKARPLEDALEH